MEVPLGWTITAKGNYLCMCGEFKTSNLHDIESHMPKDLEGFCARGLRGISNTTYECICGNKFLERGVFGDQRYMAFLHVCEQFDGNDRVKCITNFRNKCRRCDLQCHSPKDLQRHYKTKAHLNFQTKVELHCKICNVSSDCQKEMLTHLATNKHKKLAMFDDCPKTDSNRVN
jgi:hypothetical protein